MRATSIVALIGMLASGILVSIAEPAAAVPADVQAFVETLDGSSNSLRTWTSELATVGKLADALPVVPTAPGTVLGFPDLLHQWFNNGTKKLALATDDSGLEISNQAITLGDGRTGTITSQLTDLGSGNKQLEVTVVAHKTLQNQAMSIPVPIGGSSSAPQSAFTSTDGVDLTVDGTLVFDLVFDSASGEVHLVADGTTPRIDVDASAHIASLPAVQASIGILGVSLVGASALNLSAHLTSTISDPNGDNELAFTNDDGTAGELAQPGSLAGLVSFGFDDPAGSLTAHLELNASAASVSIPLPAISATIDVSWPNLAVGTPTITPTGIDAAGKFLNMTPRDLADGIAQLATTLTGIQRSNVGNVDLPFLKGTLADAIQLNEKLKTFLEDNTVDPVAHPEQAGNPTFVSLQQMLQRLAAVAGIGIADVHYVDSSSKIDFKLTLHRNAPGTAIDMNAAGAAASGGTGTTYSTTTLTDPSKAWTVNEFVGRHAVAGSSGGTVVSNTATTLTLQAPGWSPTTPTAGSAYTISGMQGDVGVVELGNDLKAPGATASDMAKGVAEANAVNATAKVKPSYDASVTLVLDLQPPTLHDPPISQANPDGSTVLVSSTPTGANRVLLRTNPTGGPSLFTADFPIDASVDIFANAGFLQVRLQGALHICEKDVAAADCTGSPSPDGHMLQVDLKDNGDLTFGQVVDKLLHHPGDLLDFHVKVRGAGSVTASVPGTASFFPVGVTPQATFAWPDITTGTPTFDVTGLDALAKVDFDPTNPKQLFAIILKTLQTLDAGLSGVDLGSSSVFNQTIPVVGRSLRDLLRADESGMGDTVTYGANTLTDTSRSVANGNAFPSSLVGRSIVAGTQVGIVATATADTLTVVPNWSSIPAAGTAYVLRSELDDAISILQNLPSDNLQALVQLLNDRLGHTTPITFEYQDGAKVGNVPSLVIKLAWKRAFHTSAPVQFDFDLPTLAGQSVAGVQGSGLVSLGASGDIKIGLVVPLAPGDGPADATALKILDDSSIGVKLDASVTGASIQTTIGPLSLAMGEPGATATDTATAKASYSVDLAKSSGDGTAQTFSGFVGAVAPTVNASSDAVTCGLADETSSSMALCAKLPLYVKNGSTWEKLIDPGENDFSIRLPKTTSPVTDYFDLTGAQIDGHDRLGTPDPTALANAILSHLIDLSRIDGIDGFLNLLIQSLNTASFGGKLPLIGEDLQQGADFLGDLKTTIDNALGGLASVSSIAGLRDWVNNQLAAGLDSAGLNPDLVKVDTQCRTSIESANAPTVTVPGATATDNASYSYKIVSYVTDGSGNKLEAKSSPPGSTASGFATLDASHKVHLDWAPAADGATGYKVFKKVGSVYKFLADVTTTNYDDAGAATTDDVPQEPADNPKKRDCDFSEFESVVIQLDVSQGDFSGDLLNCTGLPAGHECLDESVPLDIGIPGLSLRAATPGDGPHVQIGWRLHMAFGVSRSEGFFFDANDGGGTQPELAVGLNFTLPSQIEAQLAFINITAENCLSSMTVDCDASAPASAAPLFGGSFKFDITSPHSNGHLTLSDLSAASLDDLYDIKLTAALHIDWLLKAKVGTDGGSAGFPGIQAEFRLAWQWQNASPGSNASGGGNVPLAIDFLKVQIDAGEVFGHLLGPVVNQIKSVTGPLDPVIKTLYAPIPVLSDLSHLVGGDDVTLISIAKAFSTIAGGPDLTFIDTVTGVIAFINNLPECTTTCLIPIGSFSVSGTKALDNPATPSNTQSMITSPTLDAGAGDSDGLLGNLDSKDSKGTGSLNGGAGSQSAKAGFSFPVFENPSSLFNLILGGDVDLVKFDSGPLTLGFEWNQQFGPVYAPPPVMITLHGSADVTLHIVAGFDTYGIRKAFEKAQAGEFDFGTVADVFLQSLFFYTTDTGGKPIPVVSFHGEIAAGAAVSAVIITVGIEGGVALTISFLWNDPNHDGKFRISEFLQVALNNPICLFTVSGQISVFLRAYITIGFSPFSVSFSFTIVDVTLLDFSAAPDCAPPPPKLGAVGDGGKTLVVYAAALGHAADRGDAAYESNNAEKDTVKITSLHDFTVDPPAFRGVAVEMLGIRNEFLNSTIERVIVQGTGYAKPMSITFLGDGKEDTAKTGPKPPTASFEKDAIVCGGDGKDVVKTGIGTSFVDGGPGDDVIVTGDRTVLNTAQTDYVRSDAYAWVAGGGGVDSITVGNGADKVAGDGSLTQCASPTKTLTGLEELTNSKDPSVNVDSGDPTVSVGDRTVPDWTAMGVPTAGEAGTDGNDVINVGLGADTVFGNGGSDTMSVGVDNPLASSKCSPAPAACIFRSAGATLVGGNGSDHFAGGAWNDTIYTGDQTNTAADGTGNPDAAAAGDPAGPAVNIVDTGTGSDTVYGSQAIDRVNGHSTNGQADDIRGGSGEDILVGGYGADHVYGGPDDDYVIAEPATVDLGIGNDGFGPDHTVTHIALPAGTLASIKTLVGGADDDHIIGGDGGANIDGDGYNASSRCTPGAAVPSDPVDGGAAGDGNDKIIGGAGIDNVRAGGGNDDADVKANNDLLCGEHGDDVLRGGTDADQVWGGSDQDTVYGAAGIDRLYGNDGNDTVYGGEDGDFVEGNNGTDQLFGGTADDVLDGGTRLASRNDVGDTLYGDTGVDILIGDNGVDGGSPSGATVYDLADGNCTPCTHGGQDTLFGGVGADKEYGGLDNDYVYGGDNGDYIEGNPGSDHLYGEGGEDDILGGTSQQVSGSGLGIIGFADVGDVISGGLAEDVVLGDNGAISRPGIGLGSELTRARGMTERLVAPYDWAAADSTKYGDDIIDGNEANDVVLGNGGSDTIHGNAADDYLEGNQGADSVYGDNGQDDLLGGSSQAASGAGLSAVGEPDTGDTLLSGGADQDVILGDDGSILRTSLTGATSVSGTLEDSTKGHAGMKQRRIDLYDVQDVVAAGTSGADVITGDGNDDVVFGQGGGDRIQGNGGDDHLEGGQGADFVEGDAGDDDLIGGTSQILSGSGNSTIGILDGDDVLFGGDGDDLAAGDNAVELRIDASFNGNFTSKFTNRLTPGGTGIVTSRWFRRLDLSVGGAGLLGDPVGRYGGDRVSGGKGTDTLFGQDGNDFLSGGPDDDYAEGNGGNDVLRGDSYLSAASPTNVFPPAAAPVAETQVPALVDSWPGTAGTLADLEGAAGVPGQDDLIGGSTLQAFRDGNDAIEGNAKADFELGDNGALVRDYGDPVSGVRSYSVYSARYQKGAVPADAVIVRHNDTTIGGMATTRFCTTAQATCEPAGTYGNDFLYGDSGDDTQWGQDGNDTMRGGIGNDDMYGELGDDLMFGDDGQDAMVGDRGGIVDTYINANPADNPSWASPYTVSVNAPPAISYSAFTPGTFDRRVDLLHDINGATFVGSGTTAVMPHNGVLEGGMDRMRGGGGHDDMHGAFNDDIMNGDSGGDTVFGDDGADVLWGGKGCDPNSTDATDYDGSCVDPSSVRGDGDKFVDHLFGGKGGELHPWLNGEAGADIIDWQPRGSFPSNCTAGQWPETLSADVTIDPCDWFVMTDTYNDSAVPATHADNQTHHGVDWMYGGWDRDVMQADQADEGPNTGDRLLDWNGAYNLYSHCNSSYGGFNDVRQLSPAELTFIQQWSFGVGIGQAMSDVTTSGTSAYDEVAIVYQKDMKSHGTGSDFPTTPGHFDSPNACVY